MKQRILLVTTVPYSAAARLAGAFSALGAEVAAVFPRSAPIGASRYLDASFRYRALSPVESLVEAIEKFQPSAVIPCDDRAIALLIALKAPQIEASLGPVSGYEVLTRRAPSIAAAREEAIAAPLTLAVEAAAALPDALNRVGLPCVMKSDFSWGGAGVKFVCSTSEAERAFVALKGPPSRLRSLARALKRRDLHFLEAALNPVPATVNLQAFVPGRPATSVFAAKDGKVLAAQHMDVLTWAGDTGPASLMRRVRDERMDEAAAKIAARFSLSGLHGLDYVRDETGAPHLIEVNPRATQICHLPLDGDLPAALLGVPARGEVTAFRTIALFPQLLGAGDTGPGVYRDIPWDDPPLLKAQCGDALPEAAALADIAEFCRSGGHPAVKRGTVRSG